MDFWKWWLVLWIGFLLGFFWHGFVSACSQFINDMIKAHIVCHIVCTHSMPAIGGVYSLCQVSHIWLRPLSDLLSSLLSLYLMYFVWWGYELGPIYWACLFVRVWVLVIYLASTLMVLDLLWEFPTPTRWWYDHDRPVGPLTSQFLLSKSQVIPIKEFALYFTVFVLSRWPTRDITVLQLHLLLLLGLQWRFPYFLCLPFSRGLVINLDNGCPLHYTSPLITCLLVMYILPRVAR